MKIIGIIPARFASTRLTGKPLIKINGKPMIQHVYERSIKSKLLNKVIVATDDKRIFNAVKEFGGEVMMTSPHHKSGTDRIGEIVKQRNSETTKWDIIVNMQGDEPFINYRNIDKAIEPLISDKKLNVSTLCYKINNHNEIHNPNIVKVVFDKNNFALYFSRYAIPFNRDNGKINYYKHIGLYVYRKSFLLSIIKLKPSKLELSEKLEQLRILENGEKIKVIESKIDSHSVDTKQDLINLKN